MIHYQVSGTGSNWLVFVHGLTCDSRDWREQVSAFDADYRCLVVDLRGHGKSSTMASPLDIETHASDVVQLLCSLSIDKAVLIGHSMGTRVIAAACVQAPERVAGLVFVDGSRQGKGDPQLMGEKIFNMLANDADVPGFAKNMFSMMFTDRSDQSIRKEILQRAAQMPPERFREQLKLTAMWDAGRFEMVVAQIKTPFAVIQSTSVSADRTRHTMSAGDTTEYLETVKQHAPHATITVVPDCGHFTQLDAAEETNRVIMTTSQDVFKP